MGFWFSLMSPTLYIDHGHPARFVFTAVANAENYCWFNVNLYPKLNIQNKLLLIWARAI